MLVRKAGRGDGSCDLGDAAGMMDTPVTTGTLNDNSRDVMRLIELMAFMRAKGKKAAPRRTARVCIEMADIVNALGPDQVVAGLAALPAKHHADALMVTTLMRTAIAMRTPGWDQLHGQRGVS